MRLLRGPLLYTDGPQPITHGNRMDAPTTKTKTRKKGKAHRKWGRNKRKPGANNQKSRTTQNKHNRLNYERKKAGLPPVGPAAAERLLAARRITD